MFLTRAPSILLLGLLLTVPAQARLRINGSTTVSPIVVEAAALLRSESNLQIQIDTLGGSSGGLAALGDGRVEVAMSSRPVSDEDRRRFPTTRFRQAQIGIDAVALVVSRDVWQGGVRHLSREQARALYEGRIQNWKELSDYDRRVVFFNKEPGRGTWEVFAKWLYGSVDDTPLVSLPEVGSNEEARNKVAGTRGAITQLSVAWADGERIFALALTTLEGDDVFPGREQLANKTYPLVRPLYLVTDGAPNAEARELLALLLAPRGQQLVEKHGYLPLSAVASSGAAP